jgi:hypothetical protein
MPVQSMTFWICRSLVQPEWEAGRNAAMLPDEIQG